MTPPTKPMRPAIKKFIMSLNKLANAFESAFWLTPLGILVFVTFCTTPLDLEIDPVPIIHGHPVGIFPLHERR